MKGQGGANCQRISNARFCTNHITLLFACSEMEDLEMELEMEDLEICKQKGGTATHPQGQAPT